MNVQELIDELNKIADKQMEVCLEDWNEQYRCPAVITAVDLCEDSRYIKLGDGEHIADYICLEANTINTDKSKG